MQPDPIDDDDNEIEDEGMPVIQESPQENRDENEFPKANLYTSPGKEEGLSQK